MTILTTCYKIYLITQQSLHIPAIDISCASLGRLLGGLVRSELSLDLSGSGVLLFLDLVLGELGPKFVEFGAVLLEVILAIENNDVFLVAFTCLESPVERTGEQECLINNHELVVHVILLL